MSKVWYGVLILILAWKGISSFLYGKSSLCKSMDMPCELENPKTCQMKYYKLNSTDCRDMAFNENLKYAQEKDVPGRIQLNSFYYNFLSFKTTAFNVTLSDIKWKHLKFRFKQIGNELKNSCREFFIMTNATKNNFFFDCLWSNETYEGKPFNFEYESSNENTAVYKKFYFYVPLAKNIDESVTECENWEVFTYVEAVKLSSGLGPTTFYIYWQPSPQKFDVKLYNISVISNEADTEKLVQTLNVSCTNVSICCYVYSKWYGTIRFSVQPICNNSSGLTAKTLYFQLGGERAKPLLLGVIWLTVIVPIALYMLFLVRKFELIKEMTVVKPAPKLLVIHSPSVAEHVNVILALVEYLKLHCNVEAMVDEMHIFSTKTKDPFEWCNESLKVADCVMIITSPVFRHKQEPNSIYRNIDTLLLRLLREKIATQNKKTKLFVLMLPYVKNGDVPTEVQNLRKFHFPQDLNKMLAFIHEERFIAKFFFSKAPGGKEDYKIYGSKLNAAIHEAQCSIKNTFEFECQDQDSESDCEGSSGVKLLGVMKQNSRQLYRAQVNNKERLKEFAKVAFSEFPGNIESINLCSDDDDEETQQLVQVECSREKTFSISRLNL